MSIIVLIAVIIALGSFTQGLTGFGLGLVTVPLLSLVVDVKVAVPMAGIFGWLITFPVVWKMREHVQWKVAFIMFIGSLPGSYLGADLLKRLPAEVILIAMGVVLILSSLYSMRAQGALFKKPSNPISLIVGTFSGALGASVGESGPPAIAYTSMLPWSSDQTKSTIVFFFMLQMIGAIAGFWSQDLLTPEVFHHVYTSIPGFIIGLLIGLFTYGQLYKYNIDYHKIVHSLLFFIGILLVVKNI